MLSVHCSYNNCTLPRGDAKLSIFFLLYINFFFVSLINTLIILKNIIFAHPDLHFIQSYYKYFQL